MTIPGSDGLTPNISSLPDVLHISFGEVLLPAFQLCSGTERIYIYMSSEMGGVRKGSSQRTASISGGP